MALLGKIAIALLVFAAVVRADIYMHNPAGSNNRLNEANDNRSSNNRLFDSQNNDRGGYNIGDRTATAAQTEADQGTMTFYSGSILRIEWTLQHGGMHEHVNAQMIFQYMCETMPFAAYPNPDTPAASSVPTLEGLRDGTTTTASNTGNAAAAQTTVGRHETAAYSTDCSTRNRNGGLFHADQTLNGNSAQTTRQNENGGASALECTEERDYYPYWHPAPWRDIAVVTSNTSMCAYYQAESENVVGRYLCIGQPAENNAADCTTEGGVWTQQASHSMPAPDCQAIQYSRDNHLGNTLGGQTMSYNWTIPTVSATDRCVLRARYNVSTGDYDGWNTFSDKDGAASPIKDNPDWNFGDKTNVISVRLAMNTDQYGRTFQDRSHTFFIAPIPAGQEPVNGGKLYNLNVRGRRGNIVEVYPAVEYDFVPNDLTITPNDRVHIQWTGSLTTPNGAGSGTAGTDRSNMVCIKAGAENIPLAFSDPACNMWADDATKITFAVTTLPAGTTPENVDPELNTSYAYFDGGIRQPGQGVPGKYFYMCTRNNSFSNRDQKGVITVTL